MKVKYFLRGLGMGIIFSALLLTLAGGGKKEMLTDEEIMTRASLLGMVKPMELPEVKTPEPVETPAATETPEATQTPKVTETPEPAETPVTTETPEATQKPEVTETPEPVRTPEPSKEPAKEPEKPKYAELTIKGGMWSADVARALEAAGLVSSANDFDEYLCDNGYASRISTGTYKIKIGADYKEIAEKITK